MKSPATNTARLIQPNHLLKVLTTNVQSLSPKIDEQILLIQVENFYVIARNRPIQTLKTSICLRSCHTWLQGFSCGKISSNRKRRWMNYVCQKHLEFNSHFQPLAHGELFKWTSIPRMQFTSNLNWQREIKETHQLMMMSSIQCWKKFCDHNMNISSWVILIFQK